MEKKKEKISVNANLIERNNIYYTDIRWRERGNQIIKRYSTRLTICDENGKKSKKNLSKACNLLMTEERKWKRYLKEQQKLGTLSPKYEKKERSFEDLAKEFLKSKKMTQRETTFEKYEMIFNNIIIPSFKGIRLNRLKPEHFDDFLLSLKENKRSSNTIRHYYIYLKNISAFGYNRGYLKKDIGKLITKPEKVNVTKKNIFTKEQLNQCINCINDKTWKLIIFLGGFYGLRRSEIIGLRWQDIDFEKKELTVRNTGILSIVKGKEKLVFQNITKTKNSVRTLPINNKLVELLIAQKNIQKEKEELFGNSDLVVTNELNKPFRPDFLTKKFKKIIANYNIDNFNKLPLIRFHDLRHTCATLLYEAGVDIKTIQYWLGHSSIRVTLDIYTEFSQAKLNSAKNIINSLADNDITNVMDNEYEEK